MFGFQLCTRRRKCQGRREQLVFILQFNRARRVALREGAFPRTSECLWMSSCVIPVSGNEQSSRLYIEVLDCATEAMSGFSMG